MLNLSYGGLVLRKAKLWKSIHVRVVLKGMVLKKKKKIKPFDTVHWVAGLLRV
jgi:hypothetical protein